MTNNPYDDVAEYDCKHWGNDAVMVPERPKNKFQIIDRAQRLIASMSDKQMESAYWKSEDKRIQDSQALVARKQAQGWSEAEAQYYALQALWALNYRFQKRQWLSDFSEKLINELDYRIAAFGPKAYALSSKQFEVAVKAAWK
jgi:hypothetical protein